ncbi:Uncharacterized protein Rs2_10234 [Raphanus sativus]|nr:Uncharacterized protein Rs2_10234 [Raphanus sativus]
MGSSSRFTSTHMVDIKGKGILYEDNDEPIQLIDQDEKQAIKEFKMSLIGKILNPKKQDVEKLIHYMPNSWGVQDRVTANDLGNGKFLFNFTSEEDIKHVLQQGPFHFNYCMFVLVRWEPIIHDAYPWVIPFWVTITGMPLHLWIVDNLKRIGQRLGHVDTMELEEGRMLIDVDTRKPLIFSRKVASKGGEVTIQIKYDLLFKHCTTCGFLTHEKEYCPTKTEVQQLVRVPPAQMQPRPAVFDRVQRPFEEDDRRPVMRNDTDRSRSIQGGLREAGSRMNVSPRRYQNRLSYQEKESYNNRNYNQRPSYKDRVLRKRDDRNSRNSRHGPYDRKDELEWREKRRHHVQLPMTSESRDIVPYEHGSRIQAIRRGNGPDDAEPLQIMRVEVQNSGRVESASKKIASKIVTSTHDNVTIRNIAPRSLTYSPDTSPPKDAVIIGALNGMEISDSFVEPEATHFDDDVEMDDLLGDDLIEMEQGDYSRAQQEEKLERTGKDTPFYYTVATI